MAWPLLRQFCLNSLQCLKRLLGIHEIVEVGHADDDRDQPFFKTYTSFQSYTTSHARYPKIRTFYRPHAHADKLKSIADLPLLVIIHGLGGSLPQFVPLLGSFINITSVFGIELPGHGGSEFTPQNFEAFSFEALTELWKVAIEDACQRYQHHTIVLLGHSMGCSVAAALVSPSSPLHIDVQVMGLISICPKAAPPNKKQADQFRRLLLLPDFVLNVLRWFDRLGQERSNSVKRMVGDAADVDLQQLQLQFNKQFKTPVWKRISIGLLPQYDKHGIAQGGMPGRNVWENVQTPLMLIAGESDTITKAKEAAEILEFVHCRGEHSSAQSVQLVTENSALAQLHTYDDDESAAVKASILETKTMLSSPVKFVLLPAPAAHALMYDHSTYRTVAGLVEDFLAKYISCELSLGWQLQQLTTSGKWDVKNLEKWKMVVPVSGPIDNGRFRALKTLREQDEEHTPQVFLQKWAAKIFAVIDISHDSPIYDTKALEKGGVQYHKFPTISKIPPTLVEVQDFIALIERLRREIEDKYPNPAARPAIAVHCHYGYNRTGFFIACYLIEKRGYRVQDAIEEFARGKPPGIKHDHFIDTLFVRYCVGLRRGSTFK